MTSDTWPEDIPIWINGAQKWMTGLTKRTTCDDVIYALLYTRGRLDTDSTENYAVFERWRAVERPLQGCTKIVKVWSAWGGEQPNVQLLVQRLDDYFMPSAQTALTTRRSHRRPHRQRAKYSANCRCVEKTQCTCGRLKAVEHLTRFLVKQKRHLQKLERRMRDTDQQIAEYETRQHTRRVQQNGHDYVQDSYLFHHDSDSSSSSRENSLDCLFLAIGEDALDDYLNLCDSLYNVLTRLEQTQHMQQLLACEIEDTCLECQRIPVPSDVKHSNRDWEVQLEAVQIQLTRAVATSVLQHQEELAIVKELQMWDAMVREKQEKVWRLQQELAQCEENSLLSDPSSFTSSTLNGTCAVRKEESEPQDSVDQVSSYSKCFTVLYEEDSINLKSACESTLCKQSNAVRESPTDSATSDSKPKAWSPAPEPVHLTCESGSTERSKRIKPPSPSKPRQAFHVRLPPTTTHTFSHHSGSSQEMGQDEVRQLMPMILVSDCSKSNPSNGPLSIRKGCPSHPISQSHAVTEYSMYSKHSKFKGCDMDHQDHVPSDRSKFKSSRVSYPHFLGRFFELFSFSKDDSGVFGSDSSTDSAVPFDSAKLSESVNSSDKLCPPSSSPDGIVGVSLGYNDGEVQVDKDTCKEHPCHSASLTFVSSNPRDPFFEFNSNSPVSSRMNLSYDASEIQAAKDRDQDPAVHSSNSSLVAISDPHSPCISVDLEAPMPMKVQSNRFVERGCEASWSLEKFVDPQDKNGKNSNWSVSNKDLKSDRVHVIVSCTRPPAAIISSGKHSVYAHSSSTVSRAKSVRFADEMTLQCWCDDMGSSDNTGLSSIHDDDALETLV